ncbi:hypothetical protein ACL9RF_03355 [Sphingobacterium sp. Mn56C]|uniref:hypothetical protein n=1 Tax=Sphingobacterium sp. Mn56C TaxID=3395261 RepID=UPI003BD5E1F5
MLALNETINAMDQDRVTYLFNSCYNNTATEQEVEEFMAVISQDEQDKKLQSLLADKWADAAYRNGDSDPAKTHEILYSILQQVAVNERREATKLYRLTILNRVVIVAVILLIACLGYYCLAVEKIMSPQQYPMPATGQQGIPEERVSAVWTVAQPSIGTMAEIYVAVDLSAQRYKASNEDESFSADLLRYHSPSKQPGLRIHKLLQDTMPMQGVPTGREGIAIY